MARIRKFEVQTFKEKAFCIECKVELEYTGFAQYLSHPTLYEHKCSQCQNSEFLAEKYPRILNLDVECA